MDRSITYSGAVKRELPGARIVADRFHLVYNNLNFKVTGKR
jgi:transposase